MEHAVWIPGVPVSCESESIEMACLEETFVASSSIGQQLVQYTAAATPNYDDPFCVFRRKALELERDNDQWRKKMHRYPASMRELDERYTVPTIVSIGPYYHGRDHLKKAEEAKHAAAYSCIKHSGVSVQEMYDAVVSVADEARGLYDKDTMAGIEDDDFWPMMFYDACFLLQFMLSRSSKKSTMHPWLSNFLKTNKDVIYHDILLLENQLPWVVLETLARFTPVNVRNFAKAFKATLQNSRVSTPLKVSKPNLLPFMVLHRLRTDSRISLATSNSTFKSTELAHMGFMVGRLNAELFLPHILLSYVSASFLVNMAAFEITSKPRSGHGEDTAVCSYVQLLGMLMDREEDVQELRSRRILQGGGGLTNKKTLDFFTSLQGVTRGRFYHRTIRDVEMYKQNRRTWVKVYAFFYKYKKIMLAVLSAIATLSGIIGALNKK
ncbi:unnamed protein product [Alopecurus aequalis]